MATVRAAVLQRASDSDFLVRPSVVFLEAGDVFRLLNGTRYRVTILPAPEPGARPNPGLATLLGLTGSSSSRTIRAGDVHEVAVPLRPALRHAHTILCRYQVKVHVPHRPVAAVGDSDPVIIIDNP